VSFFADLRHLLRGRQFRRLFAVRVTSQFADGVFQVALASYVLFSPERQADAAAIAGTLTAVLLPFSIVGPFAGVFLDRWNRRQILFWFNLLRTLPVLSVAAIITAGASDGLLFVVVIAAFSVNRFLLAGLSAALPRVVDPDELVMANAVTPTSGTIAYICGLAAGTALSGIPVGFDQDPGVVVVAAITYCCAALLALRIPRHQLGPDLGGERPRLWHELRRVARGLLAGLRHLRGRPQAAYALAVIGAHRFWFGLTTVATILLYRNTFEPGDPDAALAGLSVTVLVAGLGFFTAAVVTPIATHRVTPRGWIVVLLVVAAGFEVFPPVLYTQAAIAIGAYFLGVASQGIKICVDTLVQQNIDDAFRGRVFSIYDLVFNVVFLLAAAVGAATIPDTGKSYVLLVVMALGYLGTALAYGRVSRTGAGARPFSPSASSTS
jgi:MFS family permease